MQITQPITTTLEGQAPLAEAAPEGVRGVGADPEVARLLSDYIAAADKLQESHRALHREVLRLRRELASADAQLQRSKRLAALGGMAAGIAHEVRNPLAAIQLYARMLEQDLDPAQPVAPDLAACSDLASRLGAAVRGLDGVVTDVLSFARELDPSPQWAPADALFLQAVEAHEPAIQAAGVQVRFLGDDVCVWADAGMMRQVLLNLVRNAVDALITCPPAEPRRLELRARSEEGASVLTVRDSGPGVPPEAIDRIFNPFFTTRSTGTGLGLAIVHRIVDAHGGTISVSNDGGAVFEVVLPRPLAGSCAATELDRTDEAPTCAA